MASNKERYVELTEKLETLKNYEYMNKQIEKNLREQLKEKDIQGIDIDRLLTDKSYLEEMLQSIRENISDYDTKAKEIFDKIKL